VIFEILCVLLQIYNAVWYIFGILMAAGYEYLLTKKVRVFMQNRWLMVNFAGFLFYWVNV